ncbi:hypothetical protein [Halomarina rubra]|uniref:Uncharacterized protein n=1 Tax=Halomarina rubra TaxID=2071873 RepID=A0ABD6B0Y6_9EURY|nr:hypothetical protein [Halomarina rubra]
MSDSGHFSQGVYQSDGGVEIPDNQYYTEWTVEQLEARYQELAIDAADCVVMHNCDPEKQDWYDELADLFMELAHREDEGRFVDE